MTLEVQEDASATLRDDCPQPRNTYSFATVASAVDCSLPGDTIGIGPGVYSGSGNRGIRIPHDLVIRGAGMDRTRLDGDGQDRLFQVPDSVVVELADLTLANGGGVSRGGGILNTGKLTIDRVRLDGNRASDRGGAIRNAGVLTVRYGELINNLAEGEGGGISSLTEALIVATRFRDNRAVLGSALDNSGGVARIYSSLFQASADAGDSSLIWTGNEGAVLNLYASTLTGTGLGLDAFQEVNVSRTTFSGLDQGVRWGASATGVMTHTVLANATDCQVSPWSGVRSMGHNRALDRSCDSFLDPATDQSGVVPGLGSLGDHGGPTETFYVPADSPLVEAGADTCGPFDAAGLAVDQRGVPVPQGQRCDIGSTERVHSSLLLGIPHDRLEFGASGFGGEGRDQEVWLQNLSREPLDMVSVGRVITDQPFRVTATDCPGRRLGYLDRCRVVFSFEPRTKGEQTAEWAFIAQDTDARVMSASVRLHGVGQEAGLSVEPRHLAWFPSPVDGQWPRSVTLKSTGGEPVTVWPGNGPAPPFQVIEDEGCGAPPWTLLPGESCALVVSFQPEEGRQYKARWTMRDGRNRRLASVYFEGAGLMTRVPRWSAGPTQHDSDSRRPEAEDEQ